MFTYKPPVLPLRISLSKDEGLYPDMSLALNLSLRLAVCESGKSNNGQFRHRTRIVRKTKKDEKKNIFVNNGPMVCPVT